MAKDYNSAKSNTSTSVKSDGDGGGKALEDFSASPGGNHNSSRSNTTEAAPGTDYNSTRSNRTSVSSSGPTTGLKSTLGIMKSGFTLVTIIVVIAAGADVYKMYSDHININLEDHVTDAEFRLTEDKNSIVGNIGFDIPKMGYFEKSTKFEIHLKILESDPVTEDDFLFTYVLGSGEEIYDEFELNNLDPITKDKIDKEEPLRIEYTITMTVIYLGVELGPTTSKLGTKVATMETA